VASISVSGSTPTPGYVLSTTGTGLSWIAAGGGGSSQWTTGTGNVYYIGNVGIGTSTVSANLTVLGNIYASNALQTTNLVANTMSLANAAAIITGNLFISNSLSTTNVIATTINASTLNVASISVSGSTPTPGYVLSTTGTGLSWIAAGGGGSSQWTTGTGNIYYIGYVGIGTSAVTADLTVAGNIYYTDDIFKRGPYLVPSPANSNAIQAWISSTCNNSSQPTKSWWATSATPTYSNIATGPRGANDYKGSVLLPDGRVLFVPSSASNVGIFNPFTLTFSAIIPSGAGRGGAFSGGVLLANGNVLMIPQTASANICNFSPSSLILSNTTTIPAGTGFDGGVLIPNGNVVMIPSLGSNIGMYNPNSTPPIYTNLTATSGINYVGGVLIPNGNVVMYPITASSTIGMYNPSVTPPVFSSITVTGGTPSCQGAVLTPNGNVIGIPLSGSNIGLFNPTTLTYSNITMTGVTGGGFITGGLLPSGNIVMCPYTASNVGMVDPDARTYSNAARAAGFVGTTVLPSGRVVFTPYTAANVGILDTFTPAPIEFCLSPYFNKL